jgi:hypothetical protein
MLSIVIISYAEAQGWSTLLAMPLLALCCYWILRKPLFIVAVWLGLSL